MKKSIVTALMILPVAVLGQSGNFLIKGQLGAGSAPQRAYLLYKQNGKVVKDSASVIDGKFNFTGTVTEPSFANLVLDHEGVGLSKIGRNGDLADLYLDKGNIHITAKDSIKYMVISGSPINDVSARYKSIFAKLEKELALLQSEYNTATTEKKKDKNYIADLVARDKKLREESRLFQQRFVQENPTSYISLAAISALLGQGVDVQMLDSLYKKLPAKLLETTLGQDVAKSLHTARNTAIGVLAPDFTQNDVNDNPVSLKDFRGKYVLLDFWASWCRPCRAENPNVVNVFNRYRDKNFTVLGVSLDQPGKKEAWLSAIKADGLDWTHVSDLKFWDSEVVEMYGIKGIPQNYLIDPSGKIIAKNLRGEELGKKLAEIFN